MWLKSYLDFTPDRPKWAFVADDILAMNVPKSVHPRDRQLRLNMFLQGWNAKKRAAKNIPNELRAMMAVADKYNLQVNAIAPSRLIMRAMPMWDHVRANKSALNQACISSIGTVQCIKDNHGLLTVGDFCDLAELKVDVSHTSEDDRCECEICTSMREVVGCRCPMSCMTRATKFLDALPTRWDPRGVLPEDCERIAPDDDPIDDNALEFDRRATTQGNLSNVFRIFTDGNEPCGERVNVALDESAGSLSIATEGACWTNESKDVCTGAGIYVAENHPLNGLIRVPANLGQSRQAGVLTASLVAVEKAN
ncbi:hypothetical protein BD309DRAFT_812244, partial [Dichomitus squalens]